LRHSFCSVFFSLIAAKVENLPRLFGDSELFRRYPYLLPCLVAAGVIALGSFLSLFLGYDGGPRGGGIRLAPEKDEDDFETDGESSFSGRLIRRVSRIFSPSSRIRNSSFADGSPRPTSTHDRNPLAVTKTLTWQSSGSERNPLGISRTLTRHSGIVGYGSAYGYDNRPRFPSGRRQHKGRRNVSTASTQYAPDFEQDEGERQSGLGFAQRCVRFDVAIYFHRRI
jgi:hypothetical protein